LTSATAGASLYYTVDGSTPTASSTLYTGPITVSANMIIKAIAVKVGMTNSAVATLAYTITPVVGKVATPTADLAEGYYAYNQVIKLLCSTEGADIYYTLDERLPTTSSTKFIEPITLIGPWDGNIKAIAVKDGMEISEVAILYYYIQ